MSGGMGVGNLVGGYLGAGRRWAAARSSVRVFFVVVVSAFIVRIGCDIVGVW